MTQFSVACPFYPDFTVELTGEDLAAAPYDRLMDKIAQVAGDRIATPYTLEARGRHDREGGPYHYEWWKITDDNSLVQFPGFKNTREQCKLRIVPQDTKSFIESAPIAIEAHSGSTKQVTSGAGMEKMLKNLVKSVDEHVKLHVMYTNCPFPIEQELHRTVMSGSAAASPNACPISVSTVRAHAQGPRLTMEDAQFSVDIEQGHLAGVFDGHCGDRMSTVVAEYLPYVFEKVMRLTGNDVYRAFTVAFKAINEAFVNLFEDGSTAVVSFIDYENSLIYTAALGDSEARIYRKHPADGKGEETWSSIPISNVRDWTSTQDSLRASKAYIALRGAAVLRKLRGLVSPRIPEAMRHNFARLNYPDYSLPGPNVSRAFGDAPFRFIRHPETKEDVEVVSVKPKITVFPLKEGDRVILACDGLFNFMREEEILNVVKSTSDHSELARALVDRTIGPGQGEDNVSVVAIEISSRQGERQPAKIGPDEERDSLQSQFANGASIETVGRGASSIAVPVADGSNVRSLKTLGTLPAQGMAIEPAELPMPPVERFRLNKPKPRQIFVYSSEVRSPLPVREDAVLGEEIPVRVKTSREVETSDNYIEELKRSGFDIEYMPPDGNSLYRAIVIWLKRYTKAVGREVSSIEELRGLVYSSICSQAATYREVIRDHLVNTIWASLKKQEPGFVHMPEKMSEYLEEWALRYCFGNPLEKSAIDTQVCQWVDREGIACYIESIKEDNNFGGLIEAKAVSALFDIPVEVHEVDDDTKGSRFTIKEGAASANPPLHLLKYRDHYDLLIPPATL